MCLLFALQDISDDKTQLKIIVMDLKSPNAIIFQSKEEQSLALNKQNTKAAESVANELRNIGDNLNESYNLPRESRVCFAKAVLCAIVDISYADIVVLLVRSTI